MPNVVDDVSESFSSSQEMLAEKRCTRGTGNSRAASLGVTSSGSPRAISTRTRRFRLSFTSLAWAEIEHLVDVREPRQPRQHQTSAPDVDPRLRVYIPSFVVRVRVRKSYHHLDWPVAAGSNGLTLMTPLCEL